MLQNGEHNSEIYVVDDDALVRESMSIVFTQAGYQVKAFCDGASVVAAARVRTPACILIDIYLPGTSGLEILKQLGAANYPAPIFVVSARRDIFDRGRGDQKWRVRFYRKADGCSFDRYPCG